jgi:PleD family two-component response regulator
VTTNETNETHGRATATIVVVHESPAVLELIEQALREPGHCVLATSNALEALDVVRRVQIDLLLLEAADRPAARELARDFRTIQPRLRVFYLVAKPISLAELSADVAVKIRQSATGGRNGH